MRHRCCGTPPLRPPPLCPPPLYPPGAEAPHPAPPVPSGQARGAGGGAARVLALHLPGLATEVLRHPGPVLAWRAEGSRRLVAAVDAGAAALGARAGQALADAMALAPGVAVLPEAPGAAAARLEALALWALRIAPLAAVDPPDGLLVNLAGTDALTGGEAAAMRRAVAGLARLGHRATAAVAPTAGAAMALARCGVAAGVAPGCEAAAIAPLPVHALRLDPAVAAGLRRLGLHRIGDLLAQPRAPLARRFGAALTLALDRATGLVGEPFRSVRPPPDRAAALDFEEPLVTRAGIDAATGRLLARLCVGLAAEGRGLRRLTLRAHRADGGVQEVWIGLGTAGRDPAHLARLLAPRLETLAPGFGFDRIALLAEETETLAATQPGMARPGTDEGDGHALSALLDRVAQRLPAWRLRPRESHLPERAVERDAPLAAAPVPDGWDARERPIRLLRRPERLEAVAPLPDDPPARIRWRGAWLDVRAAEGPERVEPEWWRDRADRPVRDYYRLEIPDGRRLWVCRSGGAGGEWFLHGVLA